MNRYKYQVYLDHDLPEGGKGDPVFLGFTFQIYRFRYVEFFRIIEVVANLKELYVDANTEYARFLILDEEEQKNQAQCDELREEALAEKPKNKKGGFRLKFIHVDEPEQGYLLPDQVESRFNRNRPVLVAYCEQVDCITDNETFRGNTKYMCHEAALRAFHDEYHPLRHWYDDEEEMKIWIKRVDWKKSKRIKIM